MLTRHALHDSDRSWEDRTLDFLGLALAHPNVPGSRIAIMAAVASASLEWAPASRAASASTLRALERYNEGVCDGQRQPVPHGLSVRAAWRATQHRGAHNSVRIARAGGVDAASSPDHAGGTRAMQRGAGDGRESCTVPHGLSVRAV